MKISLHEQYKSLRPFTSDELNNFTIITGKNGSGKSQLLSRFASNPITLNITEPIKKIQIEGIIKGNASQINYGNWSGIVKRFIDAYKKIPVYEKQFLKIAIENKGSIDCTDYTRNKLLSVDPEYLTLLSKIMSQRRMNPGDNYIFAESKSFELVATPENIKTISIANEISKDTGKGIENLSDIDFYNFPIQDYYVDNNDLFSSQIEYIYYNYAKRRDLNRKLFFYKKEDGDNNNSISNSEFEKNFTPPWEIINSILEDYNFDFYIKGISVREFSIDVPVTVPLIKKSTEEVIPFDDLSSGEKIIFGLILKLFTTKYYEGSVSLPELLILDEPDAHLHPEMSKLLLDVLGKTFVERFGIKVIITTHSPSTIALADENCIYQLTNGINTSLKKVSKESALKILTGFIPTLSIDYKNHRQVFVESPTDVLYYQSLYDRHSQIIAFPHQLYFISNAPGKSNCEQVYKIVEQIRASGNNTAYGIVDWDKKNQPANSVHVHGLDDRYSVENFILDPIYIACLLIDTRDAHGIMSKIGVKSSDNQYLLGNEGNARLQQIMEYYFTEFEKKFSSFKYNSRRIAVNYLNGRVVEMPEWYLLMQGHEIVSKVKQIFPALDQSKYRSEGALQKDLVVIMSKMYPFVPMTSIKVLQELGGVQ